MIQNGVMEFVDNITDALLDKNIIWNQFGCGLENFSLHIFKQYAPSIYCLKPFITEEDRLLMYLIRSKKELVCSKKRLKMQ